MAIPIISSVLAEGATIGISNLRVIIRGSGFDANTTVSFGVGFSGGSITSRTSTTIIVSNVSILSVADNTSYTVTVTNPGSSPVGGSATAAITVYKPIEIIDVTLSNNIAGSTGVTMTINGRYFRSGAYVRFAGQTLQGTLTGLNANPNDPSPMTMTISNVTLPQNGGTQTLYVTNKIPGLHTVSTAVNTLNPKPVINRAIGTFVRQPFDPIIIEGSNFRPGAIVTWTGPVTQDLQNYRVAVSSSRLLVYGVNIPPGASGISVSVENTNSTEGPSDSFSVPPPTLTSLTKTAAEINNLVMLKGAGRITQSIFKFPNSNTTVTPGGGNTVVEIGNDVTQNRTMTLGTTGAIVGDVISVLTTHDFTKTVTVVMAGGRTYNVGNNDSDDGQWASFIYTSGGWRLYQQAQGSRMRKVEFTSNGTFTVPSGVTQLLLHGWGGGGAGGNGGVGNLVTGANDLICSGGGGGGGGALERWQNVTVTPGTSYNIVVGQGGVAGEGGYGSSKDGKPTTFGNLATFRGARGGSDGRQSISVRDDVSTVARPGMPYEFWNSARGDEFSISVQDLSKSWFRVPQAGGCGGIYNYVSNVSVLAEFGQDSTNYSAGPAGGGPGTSPGSPLGYYQAAGGGGGAGPGGNGAAGGAAMEIALSNTGRKGESGQSAAVNTGAGGGGGGGSWGVSLIGGILGGTGGAGGSGKLTIYYVK